MCMVAHQHPCIAGGLCLRDKGSQPTDKVVLIGGIVKDFPALDAPDDDVIEDARRVYSC